MLLQHGHIRVLQIVIIIIIINIILVTFVNKLLYVCQTIPLSVIFVLRNCMLVFTVVIITLCLKYVR